MNKNVHVKPESECNDDLCKKPQEDEQRLKCLTDRQREVWLLRSTGVTYREAAERMNISVSGVRQHMVNAERRLREYDRYLEATEKNKAQAGILWSYPHEEQTGITPAAENEMPLTRAEILVLMDALKMYMRQFEESGVHNVRADWIGRMPYQYRIANEIDKKMQMAAFGKIVHLSFLDAGGCGSK